jgi:hypothetical protein
MHDDNGNKEKGWWRCGGVYGFYVFVSFSFISMSELKILLDIGCMWGWMWGKGAAKQWGIKRILAMEQEKEE